MNYANEVPPDTEGGRITFYDLRPDKDRPDLPVSPEMLNLDGKKVFIKGYVHPSVGGLGRVKEFDLVGDMGTCCFGGTPKMTDMVRVNLLGDLDIQYDRRRHALRGTLRVDPAAAEQEKEEGGGPRGISTHWRSTTCAERRG